jgi:uncharacterized protein
MVRRTDAQHATQERLLMSGARRALLVALAVTAVVTALSYLLPERYAATGVGLAFLAATWLTVLRGDEAKVPHFGLSLGGLLESQRLDGKRIARDGLTALAWAAGIAAVVFPLFWVGYRFWWRPIHPWTWVAPSSWSDEILGQVLVIALPEEAFYRGYLQTALDDAWGGKLKVAGARLGWGILASAALLGIGHVLTEPRPDRLAVFFPALLFGWLRARTGGVGAGIALHAMANIFSATLGRGYGLHH